MALVFDFDSDLGALGGWVGGIGKRGTGRYFWKRGRDIGFEGWLMRVSFMWYGVLVCAVLG